MGTHGSMTKAGKVRKQTPKIPPKPRKNQPPRIRNRLKYVKRVEKPAMVAPVARR
ncbi:MAG: 30S ribosomal protein S30e [Desulfurococcales archaeon]|nr:30S ribosomal protein S30e [Desulfurococcales archaeon]